MKICYTLSSMSRMGAGVFYCVCPLAKNLVQANLDLEVLSLEDSFSAQDLVEWLPIYPRLAQSNYARFFGYSSEYLKILDSIQPDLVHNHGLWLYPSWAAFQWSQRHHIPRVVSPHGMLEPWAMSHKAWKKRLAWNLYQRRDLESAAVLHATAEQEAESFRQLGLRPPIAIIPNGTDLPEWRDLAYPKGTPRKMLFLSRIHQKKGLLELVQAWQIVKPTGWKMIIAGPDEGGHQKIVEAAIQQAGLQDAFTFTGSVYGDEKEALYRSAEVFVLPTFSENFGLVVAEALACGVPVITTKGAPWQGLHTHRCGWWIDIGVEPLVAALREATTLPPNALRDMGQRGRVYVEQNFGWPGIAEQMLSVYRWVLGRGERPDCVMPD